MMSEDNSPDPDVTEDNAPEPEDVGADTPATAVTVSKTELDKAIARRDKATEKARTLQAELDKLKDKDKPDPVAAANRRIVSTTARTVLSSAGIVDKDVQKAVLGVLDLSRIEVGEDGEVDEDAIEDAIGVLRKAFAVKDGPAAPGTRIKATPGAPAKRSDDPDHDRRMRFLQRKPRR